MTPKGNLMLKNVVLRRMRWG